MKMKFEIKKMKWLIPALALLVIFESVVVVNRLTEEGSIDKNTFLTSRVTRTEQPAAIFFEGDEEINVGETGQVKVMLTALKELNLDGVDIYIKYDPEAISVLGIDPTDRFSYVGRNWIEPEKERILVSLMEPESLSGVQISSQDEVQLALIKFKALTSGKTKMTLFNPEGAEGTVLAGEGKEIDFSKKDLILEIK